MIDAFGIERGPVYKGIAKADKDDTARRQRRSAGALSAVPGVGRVGGPVLAAQAAPPGKRVGAGARAYGRGAAEATGGMLGAGLVGAGVGYGAHVASRGRIPLEAATAAGMLAGAAGGIAGRAHGTARSVATTQRRYGVRDD